MTYKAIKAGSFLAMLILLVSCAHPITLIGTAEPTVDRKLVTIYYPDRPACNFDTVGIIYIEGGYYSLVSMLVKMQSQAAEVGATAIYVLHTQRLDIKEYIGSAKAIRCRV